MNRHSKFAVPVSPERKQYIALQTAQEIFVSKVKLAGVAILIVVDLVVIAITGFPPP